MRGRVLRFCAYNAGADYKTRGQPCRMFGVNTSAGPPSQEAESGTGQALQGGTFPDAALPITLGVQVGHFLFTLIMQAILIFI